MVHAVPQNPSFVRKLPLMILLLSGLWGSVGCQSTVQFDDVYTVVQAATLRPGDPIPQPQGEPLLTVTGAVGATNAAGAIQMDRATIEQVGLVEYSVADPFANQSIRYTGVLMRDLLALWQVTADAQSILLTALNDYAIEIPISDFREYPILFALQADGVYMEPDFKGPAMLVYPVDHYPFDIAKIKRNWIWQIRSIEIK